VRPVRCLPSRSPRMPSGCTLTGVQLTPAWVTQKRSRSPSRLGSVGLGSVATMTGARSPTVKPTCATFRPARPKAKEPIPGAVSVWRVTARAASLRPPQRSRREGTGPAQSCSTRKPTHLRPGGGALTYSSQRAILVVPLAMVTASWAAGSEASLAAAAAAACAGGCAAHPVSTAVASPATIQHARRMSPADCPPGRHAAQTASGGRDPRRKRGQRSAGPRRPASALRARARQPALVGEDHGLHPVARVELREDALHVGLDRRLLDDQLDG